ncbi:MAG: VCBS repeat-containing protein [Clostridia bacterium]|nr:VCBS repeat-containing protein [Clostridia bacterium]
MKKIVSIILCLIICLCFSGCNLNFSSVDSLMRPPKLSGENSLLQQTFESTVGDSENILMKTPLSGENRSSYLLYDLDNDEISEALVLYLDPIKDKLACVSIFKYINDKWSFVSTIKGKSEEIYAVDFADINGDGILEILLSWSATLSGKYLSSYNGERILSIYSYNGSSTTLLKNEAYTKLLVEDINNDNADELFIVNISLSNKEKISHGRIVCFADDYSIDKEQKFVLTGMLDIYNIVCDTYFFNNEAHTRVYVDGSISESGIITEVIDIKHNDFYVSLPFYESNISAQPVTLRDVRVFSQDFDNDGVVEIPTMEKLYGGAKLTSDSQTKEDLSLTIWSEIKDGVLSIDTKCLWNENYSYMFIFPDDWIGKVTSIYNEKNDTITFYSLDNNADLLNMLFSIKSVYEPDFKDDNYIKFDENGVYVYSYYISDKQDEEMYINIIENNFNLINQV